MVKSSENLETIFIFKINNTYEEYARCSEFISHFYNQRQSESISIPKEDLEDFQHHVNISVMKIHKQANAFSRAENIFEGLKSNEDAELKDDKFESSRDTYFYFDLEFSDNDDVVDFQYYFLIKQLFSSFDEQGKFILVVSKPNKEILNVELSFKISHFLAFQLNKKENLLYYYAYESILERGNHIAPFSPNKSFVFIKRLRYFFPLIEIDDRSYRVLSAKVKTQIKNVFKTDSLNYLKDLDSGGLFEKSGNTIKFDLSRFVYDNTKDKLNSIRFELSENKEYFSSPDFYQLVKDLPVLALMVFAFSANERIDSYKNIQMDLYEAADYAAGILQLLDNVVKHSENHKGLFSFRLHHSKICENNEGRKVFKNGYLNKEYSAYGDEFLNNTNFLNINQTTKPTYQQNQDTSDESLESGIKRDGIEYRDLNDNEFKFLELFVSDSFSSFASNSLKKNTQKTPMEQMSKGSPILDVFIRNIKSRVKGNNFKEKIGASLSDLENIEFKEFFGDASQGLKDYEAHPSNFVKHYGLKWFSNSVKSAKGYFFATSTYGFKGLASTQYYMQGNEDQDSDLENRVTLPGTLYKILLPLNTHYWRQLKFVGIDINQTWKEDLDVYLFGTWKQHEIRLDNNVKSEELWIEKNSENLVREYESIPEGDQKKHFFIISFGSNDSADSLVSPETLGKAIIQFLAQIRASGDKNQTELSIIVKECPKYFIPDFVRYNMIAYDRFNTDKRRIMEKRQIYCIGENPLDDFIIKGKDQKEMRKHMINRSALRGAAPSFLFVMNFILGKQDTRTGKISDGVLNDLPYDLILKKGTKTLFQYRAEEILNRPISKFELGCKIENSHVQIGSKIHIHNFYDAEILFQTTYFTKRFAALLAKDIFEKIKKEPEKNASYKIIGYRNYSELVISQTKILLNRLLEKVSDPSINVDYYIINQEDENEDSNDKKWHSQENEKYILIVPINSTLTTFNKISFLLSKLNKLNKRSNGEHYVKVLANFGLIIVRDGLTGKNLSGLENKYWTAIDENKIDTRLISSPVNYYIELEGDWEDPYRCPLCFPPTDKKEEKPIIETNITTVIPSLQYEDDGTNHNSEEKYVEIQKPKNENIIAKFAAYKHIKRDRNHFLYYFDTNKLISDETAQTEIKKWLGTIKEEIFKPKAKPKQHDYNFLVSPLNESKPDFIEIINQNLFNGKAQTLRFDINREYRSNFITKYSYVTALAENLKRANNVWPIPSELNFYFVDEAIITGRTLERGKSLIGSLFGDKFNDEKLKVNVFSGVIVLINRRSGDSIKSHVEIKNYYYFANFPISPIRNSTEFCYMCTKKKDSITMMKDSSLIDMKNQWKSFSDHMGFTDHNKLDLNVGKNNKYLLRVQIASDLYRILNLEENSDLKKAIIHHFLKQINTKKNKAGNWFIPTDDRSKLIFESYLKLLARPFFVYRYSTREALLQLLNETMDLFMESSIRKTKNQGVKSGITKRPAENKQVFSLDLPSDYVYRQDYFLKEWLRGIVGQSDENKIWLFNLLIEQFAELSSMRIVRKDFLQYLIRISEKPWFKLIFPLKDKKDKSSNDTEKQTEGSSKETDESEAQEEKFSAYDYYRKTVTDITKLNRDQSKCVWLEHLLVKGYEYQEENGEDSEFLDNLWDEQHDLGMSLFLENTKVILGALDYSSKGEERSLMNLIDEILSTSHAEGDVQNEEQYKEKVYYLDNYIEILKINGIIKSSEPKNNSGAFVPSQDALTLPNKIDEKFTTMVRGMDSLYKLLNKENNKNQESDDHNEADKAKDMLEKTKEICELLNNTAIGEYTGLYIVDSARQEGSTELKYEKTLIYRHPPSYKAISSSDSINYDFQNDQKCFDECLKNEEEKLKFNTYYFKNRTLICKLNEVKDEPSFYFVIKFKENLSDLTSRFLIRNVLIFRERVAEFLKNKMTGVSIKSWIESWSKAELLANIKVSSHTNYGSMERVHEEVGLRIGDLHHGLNLDVPDRLSPENNEQFFDQYAVILKLLADINVSTNYHKILTHPENFDLVGQRYTKSWNEDKTLTKYFSKSLIEALVRLNNNEARVIDYEFPDLEGLANYYLHSPYEGFLLLISMIENAIKYSPIDGKISISSENFELTRFSKFLYFCISNDLRPEVLGENGEKRDQFEAQILASLRYPRGVRQKMVGQNDEGGITLYVTNFYCMKSLQAMGTEGVEDGITVEINSQERKITYKIPLLYKKKE